MAEAVILELLALQAQEVYQAGLQTLEHQEAQHHPARQLRLPRRGSVLLEKYTIRIQRNVWALKKVES